MGELLPFILLAINALMAVVMFLAGQVMNGLRKDIADLRDTDKSLANDIKTCKEEVHDTLGGYAREDAFKEFRQEQRDNINQLFTRIDNIGTNLSNKVDAIQISLGTKIDNIQQTMSNKADRSEVKR